MYTSVYLCVYISVRSSVHKSFFLRYSLSSLHLPFYLSIGLSVSLFPILSVCLWICRYFFVMCIKSVILFYMYVCLNTCCLFCNKTYSKHIKAKSHKAHCYCKSPRSGTLVTLSRIEILSRVDLSIYLSFWRGEVSVYRSVRLIIEYLQCTFSVTVSKSGISVALLVASQRYWAWLSVTLARIEILAEADLSAVRVTEWICWKK